MEILHDQCFVFFSVRNTTGFYDDFDDNEDPTSSAKVASTNFAKSGGDGLKRENISVNTAQLGDENEVKQSTATTGEGTSSENETPHQSSVKQKNGEAPVNDNS